MKKLIIFISALVIILSARESKAMSVGVGPYVWYAWWQPSFLSTLTYRNERMIRTTRVGADIPPAIMIGPAFSLKINETISWSTIFIAGNYNMNAFGFAYSGSLWVYKSAVKIQRYDVDTVLNFTITDYMKFYFGIKYQHFDYIQDILITTFRLQLNDIEYNSVSGAFGISLNWHLGNSFFLIFNLSAMYQHLFIDQTGFDRQWAITIPTSDSTSFHGFGGNSTISIAYVIQPISTIVNIGIRYQYLYFLGFGDSEFPNLDKESDHFYGLVFSVLYTFDF